MRRSRHRIASTHTSSLDVGVLRDGEARALPGLNGHLFLANLSTVCQMTGRLALLESQLTEYEQAFAARWERFASLGIPYILAPVPMKETILPELLPDGYEVSAQKLPLDRLLELFADHDRVEITDLRPALREGKKNGDAHFRTDTHLSTIGAHQAYRTIAEHPRCEQVGVVPTPIDGIPLRIDPRFRGGLADREFVAISDGRIVSRKPPPNPLDEVAILPDGRKINADLVSPPLVPPAYQVSPTRQTRIYEWGDRRNMPSAVVVGDSFTWRILPYLLQGFRRITWTWVPNPPFSVIEQERPDIVIQLIAERFLIRSPLMPGWELETGSQSDSSRSPHCEQGQNGYAGV
jgi:SGNH hydrolase-like domain, acetyltransferase AlgX